MSIDELVKERKYLCDIISNLERSAKVARSWEKKIRNKIHRATVEELRTKPLEASQVLMLHLIDHDQLVYDWVDSTKVKHLADEWLELYRRGFCNSKYTYVHASSKYKTLFTITKRGKIKLKNELRRFGINDSE